VNSTIPSHASLVFFHLAPLPSHFAAATTTSSAALGDGGVNRESSLASQEKHEAFNCWNIVFHNHK